MHRDDPPLCFTFRGLPAPPQLLHGDVLVFTVQVAVFVGLLLLHIFYYELEEKKKTGAELTFNSFSKIIPIDMSILFFSAQNILKQVFFPEISRGDADGCACLCMSMCGFDRGSRRELALPKSLDLVHTHKRAHTHTHPYFLFAQLFFPF